MSRARLTVFVAKSFPSSGPRRTPPPSFLPTASFSPWTSHGRSEDVEVPESDLSHVLELGEFVCRSYEPFNIALAGRGAEQDVRGAVAHEDGQTGAEDDEENDEVGVHMKSIRSDLWWCLW